MTHKFVIWLPFNRCDTGKDNGFRYKKTLARSDWWEQRAEIMLKYTLPSIQNQSDGEFTLCAAFLRQDQDRFSPVDKAMSDFGGYSFIDTRSEIEETSLEPYNFMHTFHDKVDFLTMIRVDSDDMIHRDFIKEIKILDPERQKVAYCVDGFAYSTDGRLASYHCPATPPPFYAITFPNWALENQEKYDKYRLNNKLNKYHHQIHQARASIRLPDGLYCYVLHQENTTSSWGNKNTYKHVGKFVRDDQIKRGILEEFGYGAAS